MTAPGENAHPKDGGPAFPEAIAVGPAGDVYPGYGGMSLRDWFASQATEGDILAHRKSIFAEDGVWVEDMSREAAKYAYADAMLAERSRP